MKRGMLVTFIFALSFAILLVWQLLFSVEINYYIVSVLMLIMSMIPFFARFELSDGSAKEITVLATMISLAVASRVAFYLVPQVKPILAVVIVSGVCLGAERGYIVGAFSAFISNFIFGQGMWTPFQMVGMGIIGFFAGVLFKYIKPNRINLSVFGFVSAFLIYGIIVDTSSAIAFYGNGLNLESLLATYISGVTFSLIFSIATAVFLLLFGETFINKIERVNKKYGIIPK